LVLPARPAQEYIACSLDRSLALDDALPCLLKDAWPEIGFEHGRHRLLELQEQRRIVAGFEQHHQATGADAADPDDLLGDMDRPEPIDQQAPMHWMGLLRESMPWRRPSCEEEANHNLYFDKTSSGFVKIRGCNCSYCKTACSEQNRLSSSGALSGQADRQPMRPRRMLLPFRDLVCLFQDMSWKAKLLRPDNQAAVGHSTQKVISPISQPVEEGRRQNVDSAVFSHVQSEFLRMCAFPVWPRRAKIHSAEI